jgi:hypothetical protein
MSTEADTTKAASKVKREYGRKLVTFLGYCSSRKEKLLILITFSFVKMGNRGVGLEKLHIWRHRW